MVFCAGFGPYQSARLSRYNVASDFAVAWFSTISSLGQRAFTGFFGRHHTTWIDISS
jgi:hypothetical protein